MRQSLSPTLGQSLIGEGYRLPSEGCRVLSPLVEYITRLVTLLLFRGDSIHFQWFSIGTVIGG